MVNYQPLPATLPEPNSLDRGHGRGLLKPFLLEIWMSVSGWERMLSASGAGFNEKVEQCALLET